MRQTKEQIEKNKRKECDRVIYKFSFFSLVSTLTNKKENAGPLLLHLMVFINSLGGSISTSTTSRVQSPPEDNQSTDKVQQRTDLEDLCHGHSIDSQHDGNDREVHGHSEESHHSCPVLFRDSLSSEGTDRGEIHSCGEFKQQKGQDGVGGVGSVEDNEAERGAGDKEGERKKVVGLDTTAREDLEGK